MLLPQAFGLDGLFGVYVRVFDFGLISMCRSHFLPIFLNYLILFNVFVVVPDGSSYA